MERQLEFPAASKARITTVLVPISNGICAALQSLVPTEVPLPAEPFCQVTRVTATLSPAVPDTAIVGSDVCRLVPKGDAMLSVGGV